MQSKINTFFKPQNPDPFPPLTSTLSEITITYTRRPRNAISETIVGSICESSKEDDKVQEMLTCRSAGEVLNKKRTYAQLHLEMGQADFLLHTCKICGFNYALGNEGDEKVHNKFHKNYTHGIPFKGWKNESTVQEMALNDGRRIVLVVDGDPPAWRNKVKEMVKMMEIELGDDWILREHCKVYLYVACQRIVGCLVAEPIERAYRIVTSSRTSSHSSNKKQKIPKSAILQFGGASFSREVTRTVTEKSCTPPIEHETGIILSEKEAVPAVCGIRAIWVTPSNRRKHIATFLLDATRKTFCDGPTLERWQLAFSQPTTTGKALLSNYTGIGSFLVYTATVYKGRTYAVGSMAFRQIVDDKPCVPPPIGYPTLEMHQPPKSSTTSAHGTPYKQYSEQHPHHSIGYPSDSPHLHFLHPLPHPHPNTRPGEEYTANSAYYIASQLPLHNPEKNKTISFSKMVLCVLVGLIVGTTLMSLVIWAFLGTRVPRFEIQAFSVPTFDINNTSSLNASWEAKIAVINTNKKLTLAFGHIESELMYKEFLMDTSIVDPITVAPGSRGTVIAEFAVPSLDFGSGKMSSTRLMNEDYETGSILFNVRFVMEAQLTAGDVWRRHTTFRVLCEDLEVIFEGGGVRRWNSKKHGCYLAI